MGMLGSNPSMASPVQTHQVSMANDLQWVTGTLETLGNPHHYINQDDTGFFTIKEPSVSPWTFTGLPNSHAPEIVMVRENIQFLIYPQQETLEQYREPPRSETLILNLPLAVIRGSAPFLSEAQLHNFLDFWKGLFVPVSQASIHYLAPSMIELPTQTSLIYVNRQTIQSYIQG
jgi:hypothetical protein